MYSALDYLQDYQIKWISGHYLFLMFNETVRFYYITSNCSQTFGLFVDYVWTV